MFKLPTMRRAALIAIALACLAAVPASATAAPRPTGRYMVAFEHDRTARSASLLSTVLSRTGVVRAGPGVPGLGIATVRGSAADIRALKRDPSVSAVGREWYRELRAVPNDPALHTTETDYGGLAGGGPIQWALAREGFYGAWDLTTGGSARVAVIDSGIDGTHPELAPKIATADTVGFATNARSDPDGHGTHTSGLACAATNNGIGFAGAGYGCRLNVIKLGVTADGAIRDEDISAGIERASDLRPAAISMSFGGGGPNAVLSKALDYAVAHGAVVVSAASNDAVEDQGAPASQLQPGDAPNLNAGRGLVVTAAQYNGTNAGTGRGPQVSLAAYGFYSAGFDGPPGLISSFPRSAAGDLDCSLGLPTCVRRSLNGDNRYAYLQGTSMAVPQVAGLAALVYDVNPYLSVGQRLRLIKETARGSAWEPQLGWGIIDARAAVDAARRIDSFAPSSRARAKKRLRLKRRHRRVSVRVKWSGKDHAGRVRLIPSGVRNYDLYLRHGKGHYRRVRKNTRKHSAKLKLGRGTYRFYTRARDKAGNREAAPKKADVRVVVRRARRT